MSDPQPTRATRRVDWLELFFDLVFVVIVKQLTDLLHGDPGPLQFGLVAGLLLLAWTVWLNVTLFSNLSGDDLGDRRVSVFVAMAGVGMMAIAVPTALDGGGVLLITGLALTKLAMYPLWVVSRRRRGLGLLRPTIYGPGMAALWLLTLLVPEPYRPIAWLVVVTVDLVQAFTSLRHVHLIVGHVVERAGLFTMIVLGESVVELILAIDPTQSPLAWVTSVLGFTVIIGFFLLYFRVGSPVAERVLEHRSTGVIRDVIGAGHYFIVLGLIGVAAGLGAAIEHADEPHLPFSALIALNGGVILFHMANAVIALRYGLPRLVVAMLVPFNVVVPLILVTAGQVWPPWVVVLVLIGHTALQGWLAPRIGRKILANEANEAEQIA
jgi:low temperature requirement protein LtrA